MCRVYVCVRLCGCGVRVPACDARWRWRYASVRGRYPWPPAITALFDVARVSTASIELAAPQCTISLFYTAKWTASQALPVALLGFLVCGIIASVILRAVHTTVVHWRDTLRPGHGRRRLSRRKSVRVVASKLVSTFVSGVAELTDVIVGALFTVSVAMSECWHAARARALRGGGGAALAGRCMGWGRAVLCTVGCWFDEKCSLCCVVCVPSLRRARTRARRCSISRT